jgi:hypothetical protein
MRACAGKNEEAGAQATPFSTTGMSEEGFTPVFDGW